MEKVTKEGHANHELDGIGKDSLEKLRGNQTTIDLNLEGPISTGAEMELMSKGFDHSAERTCGIKHPQLF